MAGGKARLPPRWFIKAFWRVHRRVVRTSRGRRGLWAPRPGKWGALRLTTTGRRSGEPRSVILGYYEDGPNLVSMAMNGWGAPEPAWWLNLQADPQAVVQLAGGVRREVLGSPQSARSVTGCGSAGVSWTRSSTATRHGARARLRSSSSSRASRPNEPRVGRLQDRRLRGALALRTFAASRSARPAR
jgi:deazaflavin-dependent oxidoreductase (nitroreductase family)